MAQDLNQSHDFNCNLAKKLQNHQIQLQYITEYSMTISLFVKIICDMRCNHINQCDQNPNWRWDNILLNNKLETTHIELPVFSDLNKKFFVAKTPNWSA